MAVNLFRYVGFIGIQDGTNEAKYFNCQMLVWYFEGTTLKLHSPFDADGGQFHQDIALTDLQIRGVAPSSVSTAQVLLAGLFTNLGIEEEIVAGEIPNASYVNKSGRNPDIRSGTVPEDMWNGGGFYTGFPTGLPEQLEFFSSSASDTGTVTYQYLASATSTEWQSATVQLNGTTPVYGVTAYRVHTAMYTSGSATTFNVGEITCRHRTTTANVFLKMPIGTSQTYVAAYTVPAGSIGVLNRIFVQVNSSSVVNVQGAAWIRAYQGTPRLRRNFSASSSYSYEDNPVGGVVLQPLTDITLRITQNTSASATPVIAGFDILLIRQS